MVLGGSDTAFPGNSWQYLEILLVATIGMWVLSGINCVGARDVAKHPIMHRTTKDYLVLNINNVDAEKL